MDRPLRYALAVCAADFVPVPVLDTWTQNRLRRRLVRGEATSQGLTLDEVAVRELADAPLMTWSRLLMWPVRKVVGKLLWPITTLQSMHETVALARRIGAEPEALEASVGL